ncbi:MAG: VWA domain-containing protein [Thermodesulfobacteriota bacterium]
MSRIKALIVILVLCVATLGVLQYTSRANTSTAPVPPHRPTLPPVVHTPPAGSPACGATNVPLTLSGALVQDKVYGRGSRQVSYLLTLCGGNPAGERTVARQNVSLVLVLDRSGSMAGPKLDEAKKAAVHLIASLGPKDRFGLVTYDDRISVDFALAPLTEENRSRLFRIVNALGPGGSTNLGGGLATGMELLARGPRDGAARLVLISDGLANQGVTDPSALADMARGAVRGEYSISAVGVGDDFDETLLASIADSGAGRYYYLSDAARFSETFVAELSGARSVVAQGVAVNVPLTGGLMLSDAGGYPLSVHDGRAVFHPGDIGMNESRSIALTFTYPDYGPARIETPAVFATYQAGGREMTARCAAGFTLARVDTEQEALASVDRDRWEKTVVTSEFGALQKKVADSIREGKKDEALRSLDDYRQAQKAKNEILNSPAVAAHLENDVAAVEEAVAQTFAAAPECAAEVRKQNAKEMQSLGYSRQKGFGRW